MLDGGNNRVRQVSASSSIVTTIAGGYLGDGSQATSATLNMPRNLTLDAEGNLYVSDTMDNRIRKVNTAGVISTAAGRGFDGYEGDGGPAVAALLNAPETKINRLSTPSPSRVHRHPSTQWRLSCTATPTAPPVADSSTRTTLPLQATGPVFVHLGKLMTNSISCPQVGRKSRSE